VITISVGDAGLYAVAILLLFLTPGPVWVAILARSLKDGFRGAWPLAVGVAIGDIFWPVLALLALGQILAVHADILVWLRYIAVVVFVVMGCGLMMARNDEISAPRQLTRSGRLAGFVAGLMVIFGNPKAILFYMGILPGFFPVGTLTAADVVVIAAISAVIPFTGNIMLAMALDQVSQLLQSARLRRQINRATGLVLILVGLAILFS